MEPTDLTVKILTEIRDAVRETNGRVDQTNHRLDQTNERLGSTDARLDQTNKKLDQTNERVGSTNARLDQTNKKLDQTNEKLDQTRREMHEGFDLLATRITQSEVRTSTLMVAIHQTMTELKTELIDRRDLCGRVDRCEDDIQALKQRMGVK